MQITYSTYFCQQEICLVFNEDVTLFLELPFYHVIMLTIQEAGGGRN